jgi:hypothetical protein
MYNKVKSRNETYIIKWVYETESDEFSKVEQVCEEKNKKKNIEKHEKWKHRNEKHNKSCYIVCAAFALCRI